MFGYVNTREQGDWGELSAMCWLASVGASVAYPIGHSPDWDLIAELGERLFRVQVKTSRCWRNQRWEVTLATRGGNQSWNGLSKVLDSSRCDYLLVVVADGRRWFIPSKALGGGSGIVLGGPKYAEYEVDRGSPLPSEPARRPRLQSQIPARGDVRVVKGARL
jgi:hypothetical protein